MKGSHKKLAHHLKKAKEHHAEAMIHAKALVKHEKAEMKGAAPKRGRKPKHNPY